MATALPIRRRRRRARLLAASFAAAAALAAGAPATEAASVGWTGLPADEIWYATSPGEDNHLVVTVHGDRLVFQDAVAIFPGYACTAGTPSDPAKPNAANCARTPLTSLDLSLGDGTNFAL